MSGGAEHDFFISHASEDKDDVARPLAQHLIRSGYRVWYDEYSLKLGDSLSDSINKGLASCDYGIVVLSPDFFDKKWPQAELDALTGRLMSGKVKKLLPVWHNVTRDQVEDFSPILANMLGVPTKYGFERVISDVIRAVEDDTEVAAKRITEGHLPVVRAVFSIRALDADGGSRILVLSDRVWDCCLLPNIHAEGRDLIAEDDPYLCDRLAASLALVPGSVHATHLIGHKLVSTKLSRSRNRERTYHFHFFAAVCEMPAERRVPSFTAGGTDYKWLKLSELRGTRNSDRNEDVFGHVRDDEHALFMSVPVSCTLASS